MICVFKKYLFTCIGWSERNSESVDDGASGTDPTGSDNASDQPDTDRDSADDNEFPNSDDGTHTPPGKQLHRNCIYPSDETGFPIVFALIFHYFRHIVHSICQKMWSRHLSAIYSSFIYVVRTLLKNLLLVIFSETLSCLHSVVRSRVIF